MSELRDYPSRLSDPSSRKLETLSYLPPLDPEAIRRQAEYIVAQGWTPAIEHVEAERAMDTYWYMWKLPMFGEKDPERILREAATCHENNPGNHVRLIGYDSGRQSQGAALVIFRGESR